MNANNILSVNENVTDLRILGIYSAKVSAMFKVYLEQCSIGQMWNVIHYAVKNLAALTQKGKHTPLHIYNMLPRGIRRYADYRLANGQTIRPWHRPSPTRASWITNILLDKILKAGDICFERLSGRDVFKYAEYLATKPLDCAAAAWFSPRQMGARLRASNKVSWHTSNR